MEIEVLTTKKKLSKSLIKQLEPANLNDIKHFNSQSANGFYIRDLGAKLPPRVALFEGINGWKIIGLREWEASGDNRLECSAKDIGMRGVSVKTMSNKDCRDSYLYEYNKMKKMCLNNHLFI